MHETNIKNIILNVDSVSEGLNSTWDIRGWIGTTEPKTKVTSLLIDGEPLEILWENRSDVYDYYEGTLEFCSGFNISIPKSKINMNLWIGLNESIVEFITLGKWVAAKSGFNKINKDAMVVDNFYADPDLVREYAMNHLEFAPSGYHKGQRSQTRYILDGTKEKLEEVLGKKIINWNYEEYANGVFQFCTADQPIVFHVDSQMYAGMVYLTPNAPPQTGTSTYKSKVTGFNAFPGLESRKGIEYYESFKGSNNDMNFYDGTQFEKIDEIGNVYNRLVIFNSSQIHAATEYFGDAIDNARFFHMFFFDVEQ